MGKWIGVEGCEVQTAGEVDVDVEVNEGAVVANENRLNKKKQINIGEALTRRGMFP